MRLERDSVRWRWRARRSRGCARRRVLRRLVITGMTRGTGPKSINASIANLTKRLLTGRIGSSETGRVASISKILLNLIRKIGWSDMSGTKSKYNGRSLVDWGDSAWNGKYTGRCGFRGFRRDVEGTDCGLRWEKTVGGNFLMIQNSGS